LDQEDLKIKSFYTIAVFICNQLRLALSFEKLGVVVANLYFAQLKKKKLFQIFLWTLRGKKIFFGNLRRVEENSQ